MFVLFVVSAACLNTNKGNNDDQQNCPKLLWMDRKSANLLMTQTNLYISTEISRILFTKLISYLFNQSRNDHIFKTILIKYKPYMVKWAYWPDNLSLFTISSEYY